MAHRKRKYYTDTTEQTCAGCRGPISPNSPFVRGMTKEPWHPMCRELKVTPEKISKPRYRQDDPVGKPCLGCGEELTARDAVVFVSTTPWHSNCRREFGSLAVSMAEEALMT